MQSSVHTDKKFNEKGHIPLETFKINPFVIKSVLESNCKRFRKSAKREIVHQKPEAQKKNSFQ